MEREIWAKTSVLQQEAEDEEVHPTVKDFAIGYDEVSSVHRISEQGTAFRKFYKSPLGRSDKIPREMLARLIQPLANSNFTENSDLPMIDGFHADFIMGFVDLLKLAEELVGGDLRAPEHAEEAFMHH